MPPQPKSETNTERRSDSSASIQGSASSTVATAASGLEESAIRDLIAGSHEEQLAAVDELAQRGTSRDVEVLMSFIASLPDGDFKEDVVRRASSIANHESMPAVLALLQTESDAAVLRAAREIFANLADAESLQTILDAYDASDDQDVRDRLAESVSIISNETAVPELLQIISDPSTPVEDGMVRSSAQALRQIGTPPAVDALIERLNSEISAASRAVIAAEVGHVTNPLAEPSLQMAALGNSKSATNVQTRITAIGALLNHPSAETQEALTTLTNDPQPEVAAAATEILSEIQTRLGLQTRE